MKIFIGVCAGKAERFLLPSVVWISFFSFAFFFEKFVGRQRAREVALFEKSSAADYIWKATPQLSSLNAIVPLYHEKKF